MRLNLQLTTTVWHAALPKGINKLVLLALCNHVNDATGLTWPSVSRLARLCGMSPRTVQTHIRALLRVGILCVRRLRTGHSTCYAVNLEGLPNAFPEDELDIGPVDNSSRDLSESVLYRPVGRGNEVVYHRSVKEFTEMVETPNGLVNRFKWWGI